MARPIRRRPVRADSIRRTRPRIRQEFGRPSIESLSRLHYRAKQATALRSFSRPSRRSYNPRAVKFVPNVKLDASHKHNAGMFVSNVKLNPSRIQDTRVARGSTAQMQNRRTQMRRKFTPR